MWGVLAATNALPVDTTSLGPFVAFGSLALLVIAGLTTGLRWSVKRLDASEARERALQERLYEVAPLLAQTVQLVQQASDRARLDAERRHELDPDR